MATDEDAPISSNLQCSQSLPCCPCSRCTAKCVRSCPCQQWGACCSSCGPLSLDRCRNHGTLDSASLSHSTHDSLLFAHGGCPHPDGVDASGQHVDDASVRPQQECGTNNIFLREKFERAFGAPLLNHDRGSDCEIVLEGCRAQRQTVFAARWRRWDTLCEHAVRRD